MSLCVCYLIFGLYVLNPDLMKSARCKTHGFFKNRKTAAKEASCSNPKNIPVFKEENTNTIISLVGGFNPSEKY